MVCTNSSLFNSENGRKSLVQIMQNQCEFFFCSSLFSICYNFYAPIYCLYCTEYCHDFLLQVSNRLYRKNQPISCHLSISIPPENIRKPKVFWGFLGVSKDTSDMKWVNNHIFKGEGTEDILVDRLIIWEVKRMSFIFRYQ